jgi:hypothetical protein
MEAATQPARVHNQVSARAKSEVDEVVAAVGGVATVGAGDGDVPVVLAALSRGRAGRLAAVSSNEPVPPKRMRLPAPS